MATSPQQQFFNPSSKVKITREQTQQPKLRLNPAVPESGQRIVPNKAMFANGPITLPKYQSSPLEKPVTFIQKKVAEPVKKGLDVLSSTIAGPVRSAMEETIAEQMRPKTNAVKQLAAGAKGFLLGFPRGISSALKGDDKYTWTSTVQDLSEIIGAQGTSFAKDWKSPEIQRIVTLAALPLELGLDIDIPVEKLKLLDKSIAATRGAKLSGKISTPLTKALVEAGDEDFLTKSLRETPDLPKLKVAKEPAIFKTVIKEEPSDFLTKTMKEDNIKLSTGQMPEATRVVKGSNLTEGDIAQAKSILMEEEIPEWKKAWNRVFDPLKNTSKQTQDVFNTWRKDSLTARATANIVAEDFAHIPEDEGYKLMQYYSKPNDIVAKQLGINPKNYQYEIGKLKEFYDDARKRGLDAGLDIGYLDNYLNQVWKESDADIIKKAGLSTKPGFTKKRFIPDYYTGINEFGLTPKYTHPAQLAAHYEYQLNKAIANKKMIDSLIEGGDIVNPGAAPKGWKYLNIEPDGATYKASPEVAQALENVFADQQKGLLHYTGGASKWLQYVTMSSGFGNLNSFSLAQTIKEVASGRIKSPVSAFLTAFSDSASKAALSSKVDVLSKMAQEGIQIKTNLDYDKLFRNLAEDKGVHELLGNAWRSLTGEKTFQNFMPLLQANFFEDIYNRGLMDGLDELSARKLAGDMTKNFYGLEDIFTRSKQTEDALSTVFFAPRFREGMVNFWVNNLKSLTSSSKELSQNRKFMVGAVLSYALYSVLNKKLSGHWMHENKTGKDLYLEIPRGIGPDGKPRSWYISFLPSVATIPRMVVGGVDAIMKGDTATATEKFSRLASQPISLATQLASNKTFAGGPIYKDSDSPTDKYKKLLGYALGQVSHPYIAEALDVAQGRKTTTEGILGALELPIYPSGSTPTYQTGKTTTSVGGSMGTGGTLKIRKPKSVGTTKSSGGGRRKMRSTKLNISLGKRYTGGGSKKSPRLKLTKIKTPKSTTLRLT